MPVSMCKVQKRPNKKFSQQEIASAGCSLCRNSIRDIELRNGQSHQRNRHSDCYHASQGLTENIPEKKRKSNPAVKFLNKDRKMKRNMRQTKNHGRAVNGDDKESSTTKQITEKNILKRPPFPSTERAPWLVFFSHGKGGKVHTICSMGDRKTYRRHIPQIAHKKCQVCSLGWVLMEDLDTKAVTLLNPVSLESIDLPPFPRLPPLPHLLKCFRKSAWSFQMTAPPTDKDCILIVSYYRLPYVMFCYPHEKKWFVGKCRVEKNDDVFLSIAVVKGDIYGVLSTMRLAKLSFDHCKFTIKVLDTDMPRDELYGGLHDFILLVESNSDMYMVQITQLLSTSAVEGFFVSKMNFNEMKWEEAENIGENRAFLVDFVGEAVSCCADEAGLQRNCIYYIKYDNYLCQYNLEDKSVTMLSYFPRQRLPENNFPRWVLPQGNFFANLHESKMQLDIYQDLEGHNELDKSKQEDYEVSNNGFAAPSKQSRQGIEYEETDVDLRSSCVFSNKEASVTASNTSKGEENRWPNLLPELVLEIILNHLSYLDSRCALLAIPEWMSAIDTTAKLIGTWYQDSPCLLTFSSDYRTCTLMDPFRDARHLIQSSGLPSKVKIMSANHGWLLLRGPTKDILFFCNPLSKVVIKLPQPPENFPCHLRLSFSTPPTSSNCVVVAEYISPGFVRILVCHKGENKWTQLIRDHNLENELPVVCPTTAVFLEQRFHWLGTNDTLGVLDPTAGLWEVKRTFKFEKLPDTYQNYLLESEDELFRVWAAKTGDSVRVYKLDYSSLTWHEVESLGDHCLFLLQRASISASVANLRNKRGRIYFPMLQNGEMVYYSYHTHQMLPSSTFYDSKEFLLTSCWIQPSWVQHAPEELQWC